VNLRCLFLAIGAAAILAATGVAGAAAKPPKDQAKVPPRGTPGVAARSGQPGTITITQYTADGATVLGSVTVPASASDTSASVAAAFGSSAPGAATPETAPAPVKTGPITEWDDAGRPGAPVAQAESRSGTRQTSAVRRAAGAARAAACCSSSGCEAVDVTRDIDSDIFGSWLGTFHHLVYWCWSYPRVTEMHVACWSDVDGSFIDNHGCDGWGSYYSWRGSSQGGHVSFRQGDWDNCVFFFGCFKSIYPWIEVWVNGNGAWAQDQGG